MKTLRILALLAFSSMLCLAGDLDARKAFGTAPGHDLNGALARASTENKRVLLIFWDSKEKSGKSARIIEGFTGLDETKALLKQNFIVVLLDQGSKDVARYVPQHSPEISQLVLISPKGDMLKAEPLTGNPGIALDTVKLLMAIP